MSRRAKGLFQAEAPVLRKLPRQARSEDTIRRIERAMLELVAAEGYNAVSTNRIARRARVNISSLYQYFPNKQSIALALYQRASAQQAQIACEHLTQSMALPLESGIRRLLEAVADFLDHEQLALISLVDEVPELREMSRSMALENLAYQTSQIYLERHLGKLDEARLRRKLFFVQHLGMGLIRRYVQDKPQGMDKAAFIDELAGLIVDYLRKDR